MNWVSQLIGKPYAIDGQGPDSFNCWALVRHALWIGHGVDVPILSTEADPGWRAVALRAKMQRDWKQSARPRAADILVMVGTRRDLHVGLFLDDFRVLHTSADAGESMVQRMSDFRLLGFGGFEVWRRG